MVKKISILLLFIVIMIINTSETSTFKSHQMQFARVKSAYKEKLSVIENDLKKHDLKLNEIEVFLKVFKTEKILELWVKNKSDKTYKHLKDFKVCANSGEIGPKRKMGDLQTPEGFYLINRFNPVSNYHLSLGVNYPNHSDKILGDKNNLGGDIFIHGDCVTIGCVPITDDKIKEMYIYCLESQNNGNKINVVIFPCILSDKNYNSLIENPKYSAEIKNLWKDLKVFFDYFEKEKKLPKIEFLSNGRHLFKY